MRTILAIDQSTSATKAILFSETGELLDRTSISHEQIYPRPGWVEHDAEQIYRNTLEAVSALLARNTDSKKYIAGVSITNQRETFVVFEKGTGKPLYHAIVWQCRRGEEICRQMGEAGHEPLVQERTGLKIDTYFPASKIGWLLNDQPAIAKKLADGEAYVGTIDAYLIYRLTGGTVFATDQTNASRTLLFDINKLAWDDELCELFGVPRSALPEVYDSNVVFGETDFNGLLDKPLPIAGVMGDSQAALFAQRCFEPGTCKVTFGTGSSVLLNIGEQPAFSDKGIVTAVAWVIKGRPVYAFEGITNFTGATIAWLRDQLGLIESVEQTEELAKAVDDNGGVFFVPAFVGLSAPYWQPKARAAIVGLSPSSKKNHIVRAALEGIAFRIRDVVLLMAQDAGVPLQHIHADGGAVQNSFLMQFVADEVQVMVRASRLAELSAQGAALAGMLGTGIYESLDDLKQLRQPFVDYEPGIDAADADRAYQDWLLAVNQVLANF
jgi:glycerol kinase